MPDTACTDGGQKWQGSLLLQMVTNLAQFFFLFFNSVYHITDAGKQNTFQQLDNGKFFNEESFLKSGEMKNNIYFKMHPSD